MIATFIIQCMSTVLNGVTSSSFMIRNFITQLHEGKGSVLISLAFGIKTLSYS